MNIASVLATKDGKVFTIGPEQPIREALGLLARHGVGALVVVDEVRRPVGILSERDIVRTAAQDESLFPRPVREIMTKNVIVGSPHDDLKTVGRIMTEKRIRHLPIMDQRALVGIVSIGDVVKALRDQYEGQVDTLQVLILEDPGRSA